MMDKRIDLKQEPGSFGRQLTHTLPSLAHEQFLERQHLELMYYNLDREKGGQILAKLAYLYQTILHHAYMITPNSLPQPSSLQLNIAYCIQARQCGNTLHTPSHHLPNKATTRSCLRIKNFRCSGDKTTRMHPPFSNSIFVV